MNRIDTFRESTEGFSASEKALVYGFLLMVVLVAGLMLAPPKPAHADTTFTVNSTADRGDQTAGDGSCYTGTSLVLPRQPECTLRAAIEEANAFSGADTINFSIPASGVKTISPNSALPEITDKVTIDGYSQPRASPNTLAVGNDANLLIELNGANTVNSLGLFITASDSVVRGLVINRFDLTGIAVGGARNEIEGNFVGTDVSGTLDLGNGWEGVFINGDSHTVGGTSPAARNVISGNDDDGVAHLQATGSEVQGNYIGTDASGTQDLGNTQDGVRLEATLDNTIGGTEDGAANTIAFNGGDGVRDVGISTGNRILRNSIFANGQLGIDLGADGVTDNDLGTPSDTDTGANNLQNFPEITSAKKKRKGTLIEGYLISTPNTTFTLQFFSNTLNDPDEGKTFIGQLTNVQTNENGAALFSIRVARKKAPVGLSAITATATNNSTGDTSEFSQNVEVRAGP